MRLTTVILIASLIQVSAATFGQRITLSQKNVPLKTVLRELTRQTGYDFVYNGKAVGADQKVSVSLNNTELDQALRSLLPSLNLTYKIDGKIISIRKEEQMSLIEKITARFQAIDVRGRVLNEQNQPLAGATVTEKGKNQVTKTDAKGNFYLQNVDDKATLLISFVGFKPLELGVKEDLGVLILKLEDNSLDQVQVIAYGQVQKKYLTGNVGAISGEVISKQPVTNPLLALQGRTPGLFIKQSSGSNAGTVDVVIQGKNSLRNGNVPFYVIDGVPYTANALGSFAIGGIAPGATSNLNFINPSDIESISILKDADATAIYGSRAANGAILITTKKGKSGLTKVDLNLQTGWSKVANRIDLLNTQEYLEIRREAFKNNGNATPNASDYDVNGAWDQNRYTDWQKELTGGTAQFQNMQASISGGNERTQFLIGAGLIRETTVFSGDFSNVKATVNFNINNVSANGKFQYFLSGSYLNGLNRLPQADLTADAITLAPNAPALYNPDGTLNWDIDPTDPNAVRFSNPLAVLEQRYQDKSNNLIANSQIAYEVAPGISLKSSFGFNRLENNELATYPLISVRPDERPYFPRRANYANKNITSWIVEPQASFNRLYSFGNIEGLVGVTFQNADNYSLAQEGSNYSSDAQLPDLNAAGTKNVITSIQSTYRYSALFGRINYRLQDKYILSLSARRDGSSRFGSENLFNNFYAVGGAWLFSEESFLSGIHNILNYGKLRFSYGTTGNDQISDYYFYSLYDNYGVAVPYQNAVGLYPRGHANPFLQWEETKKLNFGIETGFLNNTILIRADHFRNRSSNQLLYQNLSFVTGFSGITRNLPATVQNTGWEFTLDYTPVKGNGLNWSGSANITLPKNKLIRYDGLAESSDANDFIVGESINIRRVYKYEGVDPETGLYQFRDAKGQLTSAPEDPTDKIAIVSVDPKWYGGFSNTFSYKGFSLDIFFQFAKQMAPTNRFGSNAGLNSNRNQPKIVLNRWQQKGDIADIQKVTTNFGEIRPSSIAATNSDAFYDDAAYARLKNVSLSYRLKENVLRALRMSNARFYVQGQNLYTWTKFFGGIDPETQSAASLAPLRTITIGTQLTF